MIIGNSLNKSKIIKILKHLFTILFWIFVPIKLFVFDIDQLFFQLIAPDFDWILKWKFIPLSAIVIFLIAFTGYKQFILFILFIIFYPVSYPIKKIFDYFKNNSSIVVKFFQKYNFIIFLFATNYLSNIYKHINFRFFAFYLFLISIFLVYNINNVLIIQICGWYIFIYLLLHYVYRFYTVLKPSPVLQRIIDFFEKSEKDENQYLEKLKSFEETAVASFLIHKGKIFFEKLKSTQYLFIYFTISFLYTFFLTVISLGVLHNIVFLLNNNAYKLVVSNAYLFFLLSFNSIAAINTNLIEPISEFANLLVTFAAITRFLIFIIYGVYLINIFKNHFNYSLEKILEKVEIEEKKMQLYLKDKYNKDLKAAIKEIEESFQVNDYLEISSAEVTEAKILIKHKNYPKAEKLLKEYTNLNQSGEGKYLLGYVLGEQNKINEMLDAFAESQKISDRFIVNMEESKKYHWADNFNKGVSIFNKAAKVSTKEEKNKLFNKAIKHFNYAILCRPNDPDAYKNLAYAYINMDNRDAAIEPYEKVVELTKDENAYVQLGDLYVNQGIMLKDSSKEDEGMESLDKAIKVLEEGKSVYPNSGDILLLLSNSYIAANKLDVAKEAFKDGVNKEPENQYYRYNYGSLLLNAEEYEGAAEQLEKALEIDPEYENAIYNLAVTYVKWGAKMREDMEEKEMESDEYKTKFQSALLLLEKYLSIKEDEGAIWDLLGKVYANLGMAEKSKEAFEKADLYR